MNADFKITNEQIQAQDNNPVTVFHLSGWLDAQSEGKLLSAALEAHTAGTSYLILSLQDVDMLTSTGIRAIQSVQKLFTPPDANTSSIRLCNAPPNVYHVLKLTGFLQILPVYESLQSALDSFTAEKK